MMSWIAWIHDLVGACDSDELTVMFVGGCMYLLGLEILVYLYVTDIAVESV